MQRNVRNHTACMQESALGNEEEQLVSLLLSKGAAESALADEMGRLKVQEEVCILWQHPRTIYNCKTCGSAVYIGSLAQQHVCC